MRARINLVIDIATSQLRRPHFRERFAEIEAFPVADTRRDKKELNVNLDNCNIVGMYTRFPNIITVLTLKLCSSSTKGRVYSEIGFVLLLSKYHPVSEIVIDPVV